MTPVSISPSEKNAGEPELTVDDSGRIAGRFLDARRAAGAGRLSRRFPATLDEAYAIQDEAIARWGRPVIGWKVGRMPPPLIDRFGADRLAGPIFADSAVQRNGRAAAMPVFADGFAAGEAEFLLRIGAAPPAGQDRLHARRGGRADRRRPCRHRDRELALGTINELGPIAVISDFGNNNGLVDRRRRSRTGAIERLRGLAGRRPGSTARRSDRAAPATFPDGAIGAARFLFELMARRGIALTPGQWISSRRGHRRPSRARPGQRVEARFRRHASSVALRSWSRPARARHKEKESATDRRRETPGTMTSQASGRRRRQRRARIAG